MLRLEMEMSLMRHFFKHFSSPALMRWVRAAIKTGAVCRLRWLAGVNLDQRRPPW
jgi:hypothetical protein